MSLEAQITELTAAINKLSTISQALHDLRVEAIETTTASAASTKTTKATTKEASKQAIQEQPENRTDPIDEMTQIASDYIGGSDREEERAARKEKIRALLNHDKIRDSAVEKGAGKFNTMKPDAHDLFKAQVAKLAEKGDITTPKSDDDLDI